MVDFHFQNLLSLQFKLKFTFKIYIEFMGYNEEEMFTSTVIKAKVRRNT